MKKWIGALCSGLAGVLSLVFLAMPALKMKGADPASGWDLLTDKVWGEMDLTAVTWYRIFAWIMVVLAIVLIIVAILQVLANLNVIKMPEIISKVAKYALIAVAVSAVLVLVAGFGIRGEMIDMYKDLLGGLAAKEYGKMLSVGIGLWLVVVTAIVALIIVILTEIIKSSDKEIQVYRLSTFLFCYIFGFLGFHRFYVGKKGTGILYLFTAGLLGIGVLVDIIKILRGTFTDGAGNRIITWVEPYKEY